MIFVLLSPCGVRGAVVQERKSAMENKPMVPSLVPPVRVPDGFRFVERDYAAGVDVFEKIETRLPPISSWAEDDGSLAYHIGEEIHPRLFRPFVKGTE
jgi:hypothetical protein